MTKIIGILKFIVSVGGTVVIIMTCFNLKTKDLVERIISLGIIFLVGGIYIYYLTLTGIWNVNNRTYKTNILLILGLLIHFIFVLTATYFSYTSMPFKGFLTSSIALIFAIAIGVFDVKQLIFGWKNKKSGIGQS